MPTPIDKVSSGDPFAPKAGTWNSFVDAANEVRMRRDVNSGAKLLTDLSRGAAVILKNTTGAELSAGVPVKLGAPVIGPTDNIDTFRSQFGFAATTPAANDRIAITTETIKDTELGGGLVSGVAAVQVTIATDAPFLDRCDSTLALHAGGPHRVLWRETGTGTKWAWIQLNEFASARYRGTAVADIAADTSGDVEIGEELGFVAGYQVDANLSWMHGSEKISAGREVVVEWFAHEGLWIITGAECEA